MSGWKNYYEQIEDLGSGGNAKVYRVQCKSDASEYALKELISFSKEKKYRFQEEVNIMNNNHIIGMLPIIKTSSLTNKDFWYVMPIAQTIKKHISDNGLKLIDIISGFIQLAETLIELHGNGISHRDIKPENIYFYENRFTLGDFGLVNYPNMSQNFTTNSKWLGAIFTIAPEMRQNPNDADGRKADVYSLAKTLWILLTGKKSFDGVYDFLDPEISLRFVSDKYKREHLVEIEELLYQSTNTNPDLRPNINEFCNALKRWCSVYKSQEQCEVSEWIFIKKILFPNFEQSRAVWQGRDEIVGVLNVISTLPVYNHMFFSSGGGLDFYKAEKANEEGCIYVCTESLGLGWNLVKPRALYFTSFNNDPRWNYFLLELDELEPIFEKNSMNYERLVEDYPANYVSSQYFQYGVYDYDSGEPLPVDSKLVYRYLKGSFLIVLKTGAYNSIGGTYDGRHGDCTPQEFDKYMHDLYEFFQKWKEMGYSEEVIANVSHLNKNPFKENDNNLFDKRIPKSYPDKFIRDNYGGWNLKAIMPESIKPNDAKIAFFFKFRVSNSLFGDIIYLLNDGTLTKKKEDTKNIFFDHEPIDNCYYLYDRALAIEFLNKCNTFLDEICIKNGYDEPLGFHFFVGICKIGTPTHLFSKNEIEHLMRQADDRHGNMLVIDEDGYAHVTSDEESWSFFPVRHEKWNAGNNYVGKYSSLSSLDDVYLSSLEGFLDWLQYGIATRRDYVSRELTEQQLEYRIRHLMEG